MQITLQDVRRLWLVLFADMLLSSTMREITSWLIVTEQKDYLEILVSRGIEINLWHYLEIAEGVLVEEVEYRGIPFAIILLLRVKGAIAWTIGITAALWFGYVHGGSLNGVLEQGVPSILYFWLGYNCYLHGEGWLKAVFMCCAAHMMFNTELFLVTLYF